MILEQQILPFWTWFRGAAVDFLAVLAVLVAFGLFAGYLLAALQHGPGVAFGRLWASISAGLEDLRQLSLRRVVAMTRLAIKESVRRNVLVVFMVFVVILLFAGWYLDTASENPATLYISSVLKATNFLIVMLAVFLSTFSLPQDIKNKTIFTVVTKPVRAWEIVLGRILGFAAVGTLILGLMCLFSYVFVTRGLHHKHRVEMSTLYDVAGDQPLRQGKTTLTAGHRHEFTVDEQGKGVTDARRGHYHVIRQEGERLVVGKPQGNLEARVPVYGSLRFLNRKGELSAQGINVGKEWFYRGYVEGRTLSAGIWRFENLKSRDYPDGLPVEMTIRVFRTYKGEIERGILGKIMLINGDPDVHRAFISKDPNQISAFNKDTAVESEPFFFYAQDFTPESRTFARKVKCLMLDGSTREVDLFESLATAGSLEIKIQCEEPGQYYGMAQADLYIRAADKWFGWNFVKAYATIWLQMLVVTSFGVMFSTFLTGSVALLATIFVMVMGYFSRSIVAVATGEQQGGGPIESLVRVFRQDNLVTEMEAGISTTAIKMIDVVAMTIMRAIAVVMPNFRDYAEYGGLNTVRFVASGFDISSNLMWQHVVTSFAYVTIAACAGYFLLKSKEVAA
jgi:hypothetical protein